MFQYTDLANEIILNIFSYIHPSTLVDFACTSKHSYILSGKFLETHRNNQSAYYEVNDRCPRTIPEVLQAVLADLRLAWYIKRLVIYNNRASWGKSWYDDVDDHTRCGQASDSLSRGFRYSADALQRVLEALGRLPSVQLANSLRPSEREQASQEEESLRKRVQDGCDGPLKLLLACLATNLDTIVVTAHRDYRDDFVDSLSKTLQQIASMPIQLRPKCFGSVANVHLNYRIKQHFDHYRHSLSVRTFAPFLTLPALHTLKTGTGGGGATGHTSYKWEYTPQLSTVKHLGLGRMSIRPSEVRNLIGATQGLKSFSFDHYGQPEFKGLEKVLLQKTANTLEAVDFGNIRDGYAMSTLRNFHVLKQVSMNVSQLFHGKIWSGGRRRGTASRKRRHFVNLSEFMPPSIETVRIIGKVGSAEGNAVSIGLLAFLAARDPATPALRGVCVRNLSSESVPLKKVPEIDWTRVREAYKFAGLLFSHSSYGTCVLCVTEPSILDNGLDAVQSSCS